MTLKSTLLRKGARLVLSVVLRPLGQMPPSRPVTQQTLEQVTWIVLGRPYAQLTTTEPLNFSLLPKGARLVLSAVLLALGKPL